MNDTRKFATRSWMSIAATAIAWLVSMAPAQAAYTYTYFDVPGATSTAISDITDSGAFAVTGYPDGFVPSSGYLVTRGEVTRIDGPTGAFSLSTYGLSADASIVVGSYFTDASLEHQNGFVLDGGVYQTFDFVQQTEVRGISPDGRYIDGTYSDAQGDRRGFAIDRQTGQFYDPPFDDTFTTLQGIDSAGRIVGSLDHNTLNVIWDVKTGETTFFNLPGGIRSAVRDINDAGVMTGFLYTDHGIVPWVGSATAYSVLDIPIEPGGLALASAINNRGQIVGQVSNAQGVSRGFIATPTSPIPEPQTGALMLGGLLLLRRRLGRRVTLRPAVVG